MTRRPSSQTGFSFIQATDLHYIEQPTTRAAMAALVEALNRHVGEADFVVFTGDLTEHATPEEFAGVAEALQRLRLPWHAIPGNHDMNRRAWLRHFPRYDSFASTHAGVRLFFLDSNEPDDAVWVTLSPAKLAWIDAALHETPRATPILFFLHHPLGPGCPKYGVKNACDVITRFQGRRLLASISGHYHSLWQTESGGALFTTCTCLLDTRANHDGATAKGYRVFRVQPGGIASRFVQVSA